MADNTQLNAATTTGDVIATDDVAGVKHQLVKLEYGPDGAATRVDTGTPLPVTAATLPLPSNAATGTKQDTGNASLAQIHADLTGTLTVLGAVSVSNLPATQPVSGTVAISAGSAVIGHVITDTGSTTAVTGNVAVTNAGLTNIDVLLSTRTKPADQQHTIIDSGTTVVTQPTGTNLHTVVDSGVITSVTAITNPLPAGTNVIGHVITDTGSTTAVTGNVAVTNAGLTNLDVALSTRTKPADQQHTIIDSGTTAVTQTTGTNLHTVVDSGVVTANVLDVAPATQNITAQDVASVSTAMANSQNFITGTPTTNSAASFSASSKDSVKIQVTGTWTGTLAVEQSIDGGTTWVTTGLHQTGSAYTAGSFTNNFIGGLNISGATNIRVRATASWTGTATVAVVTTQNPNSVYVANGLSIQDSTTATQKLSISSAGAAKVAIDQTTPGTTNAVQANNAAIVSDSDTNYTQGAQSALTITSSGKLRVEVDDLQRRIEEAQLIEMQKQTLAQMYFTESSSAGRYGVEIR